jgi:hypothetical protein
MSTLKALLLAGLTVLSLSANSSVTYKHGCMLESSDSGLPVPLFTADTQWFDTGDGGRFYVCDFAVPKEYRAELIESSEYDQIQCKSPDSTGGWTYDTLLIVSKQRVILQCFYEDITIWQ